MSWKTKTDWMRASVLIIGNMAMVMGCSAGLQNSVSNHHTQSGGLTNAQVQETYESLTRQGQFTKATILSSLYDSSSFNMRGPELDARTSPEDASALNDKGQALTVRNPEKHPASQPSPLQVHLPPELVQRTDLDEKGNTELGWALLIGGNYEGAVAAYREAIRQNGKLADAYLGLGTSLKMQNQVPAAIEAYQQALHLQPDYASALVHLGYIYADGELEHRDVEKAKQLFQRASQLGDPFATIALQDLKTRP